MPSKVDTARYSSLEFLHPICRNEFIALEYNLKKAFERGGTKTLFMPFESYRTPARQAELIRSGDGVTKAGAWQSAHQFGLAVDFAAFNPTDRKWNWDKNNDWGFLKRAAEQVKLVRPYDWDLGHIASPRFKSVQIVLRP